MERFVTRTAAPISAVSMAPNSSSSARRIGFIFRASTTKSTSTVARGSTYTFTAWAPTTDHGAPTRERTSITRLSDKEAVLEMLQRGHDLMERLAGLPFPTVAAIHGACLGGGLELALACRRRVATQHPKTKLGLPEVQLGLIPGLGGTQRLPRLIGVPAALDMILTSKQLDAKPARKAGLVDDTRH